MFNAIKSFIRYLVIKAKHPKSRISYSAHVSLDSYLGNDVCVLENSQIGASRIERFCYIGMRCQISRAQIGPFCSFGSDIICGTGAHPLSFVSTYPGFYSSQASGSTWFGSSFDFQEQKAVSIGADVWIGSRSIILGGVTVGNGAVIGAGAVVTKDVPPYAVVAGVPAKVIKYRFDFSVIKELQESEWWTYPESKLKEAARAADDIGLFLNILKS